MHAPVPDRRAPRARARALPSALAAVLCTLAIALPACEERVVVTPPPPEVGVAQPIVRDITRYADLAGRTEAAQVVEVRARVEGILLDASAAPGSSVKEGDILFRIDPDLFTAERDAAAARVDRAAAELKVAEVKLDRVRRAADQGAANEIAVLEAEAAVDTAAADLEVARRELAIKQLSVDHTEVRAPLAGELEAGAPDIGSLVGTPGEAPLTRIYDTSSVRVWLTVPDRLFLETAARNPPGETNAELAYPIRVATEADEGFPHPGVIDYVDPAVDTQTGTIRLRATVPNPTGALKPGLFVRCRLVAGELQNAILIPEAAISSGQIGRYVLVVAENNIVEARPVTIGPREGPLRVIDAGLEPTDRVIIRGLLRARPGQPVNAVSEPLTPADAETP